MNRRRHNFRHFLPALVMGISLLLLRSVVADDRSNDPEIGKILRERLAVLQEAATPHREGYRSGTTSLSATLAADQAVLEAELELVSSAAERVGIRKRRLENAEMLEKAVEALVKAAEAPRMDLLAARANSLRAKADLLLEQKAAAR